jgi:hypothetical protein
MSFFVCYSVSRHQRTTHPWYHTKLMPQRTNDVTSPKLVSRERMALAHAGIDVIRTLAGSKPVSWSVHSQNWDNSPPQHRPS